MRRNKYRRCANCPRLIALRIGRFNELDNCATAVFSFFFPLSFSVSISYTLCGNAMLDEKILNAKSHQRARENVVTLKNQPSHSTFVIELMTFLKTDVLPTWVTDLAEDPFEKLISLSLMLEDRLARPQVCRRPLDSDRLQEGFSRWRNNGQMLLRRRLRSLFTRLRYSRDTRGALWEPLEKQR